MKQETLEITNPWDGSLLRTMELADEAGIEQAVKAAVAAFANTRKQSRSDRAALLVRVAEGIRARESEFVETLIAEAGKPRGAAEVEVARAQDTFRFAAREAVRSHGEVLAMDASEAGAGHSGVVERFPLGVILGITPFNFPLNLVAHKVAPCIATGNTMIVKPALKTPLSALLLGEVLRDAGMIAGQVQVVLFDHRHVDALLKDGRIRMTTFTGSDAVGWKLKGRAVKQRVTLELGGNAAVIVQEDADWRAAVPMIAKGAFGYAGQSCISVQRVFLQRKIYGEFREAFVECVLREIRTGDPRDAGVTVGPLIDAEARERVLAWVREAEEAGAKRLTPLTVEGNCIAPVVLENVPETAKVSCEEVFGPVAVLAPYETFEEALTLVNGSRFGLQAGVFTANQELARRAFEEIEAGGVLINQVPTFRVENMPYGGVKDSGFGREGLRYAMEEMTEMRSMIVRHG